LPATLKAQLKLAEGHTKALFLSDNRMTHS